MKRSTTSILGLLGLIIVLVLINGVSRNVLSRFYFDFTQDGLYSLSAGTRNIVKSIDQPITLKYYFSKTDGSKYPSLKLYGSRILDLLRQYERVSGGKLRLEIYDPRPDSEEEEWADKYGLAAIPAEAGEKLYLGLAGVNSLGEEQIIPVFNFARQEFLEYDISRIISTLETPKKPVIGLLSPIPVLGLGMSQEADDGWFAFMQLAQSMELKKLPLEISAIEPEIDLLIVFHPKNFAEQTLFAIDQYVMRGGKLMVFVDPFSESDEPKPDPNDPAAALSVDHSSNLNALLKNWGVEQVEKKVLGDLELAARVNTGGEQGEQKRFVLWANLTRDHINAKDLATSQLETLVLPWPGTFKITKLEGVETEVLLKSSKQTQLLDEMKVKFGGGDPDSLLRTFVPSGEEYPFAVRVRGKLKSNFPEGAPKNKPAEGEAAQSAKPAEVLKESVTTSNLLVVSDVDFLANRFSVHMQRLFGAKVAQLLNDNVNFFANAVENMLGSDDLISIRSRGQFSRPFTRVERMETAAQQQWQQQEVVLQAQLNSANQRLTELQSRVGANADGKQVLNSALLDEIKKFKQQRREAQQNLRNVRRNLRQNIERLGEDLFLLNTFFVPLLLIIISVGYYAFRKKKVVQ